MIAILIGVFPFALLLGVLALARIEDSLPVLNEEPEAPLAEILPLFQHRTGYYVPAEKASPDTAA